MINKGQTWELLQPRHNPELELFDSVINEFTSITGFHIHYFVKLWTDTVDPIYGEDPLKSFSRYYETKVIYEPTEELSLLDSFGISSNETIQSTSIPKTMFQEEVSEKYLEDYPEEESLIPRVGDVIKTLWNNNIYEIVDVGEEEKIFQAKKQIWRFVLRPYRRAEESDSSKAVFEFDEDENYDINSEMDALSGYGDNQEIEEKSDEIKDFNSSQIDTTYYGY